MAIPRLVSRLLEIDVTVAKRTAMNCTQSMSRVYRVARHALSLFSDAFPGGDPVPKVLGIAPGTELAPVHRDRI